MKLVMDYARSFIYYHFFLDYEDYFKTVNILQYVPDFWSIFSRFFDLFFEFFRYIFSTLNGFFHRFSI